MSFAYLARFQNLPEFCDRKKNGFVDAQLQKFIIFFLTFSGGQETLEKMQQYVDCSDGTTKET